MTIQDIIPHINDLYDDSCVGCCLHIVTDDFNIDNDNIEFCIIEAAKRKHLQHFLLAIMLRLASKTQRKKACLIADKFN